jgi:hypothetical protein
VVGEVAQFPDKYYGNKYENDDKGREREKE